MITILSYAFLALYLAGVLYTVGMFFYLMFNRRQDGETTPPVKHRRLTRFMRKAA
jgi:predicted membrane channel-forming protein YqfA (hemolysin III family)